MHNTYVQTTLENKLHDNENRPYKICEVGALKFLILIAIVLISTSTARITFPCIINTLLAVVHDFLRTVYSPNGEIKICPDYSMATEKISVCSLLQCLA